MGKPEQESPLKQSSIRKKAGLLLQPNKLKNKKETFFFYDHHSDLFGEWNMKNWQWVISIKMGVKTLKDDLNSKGFYWDFYEIEIMKN